MPDLTDETSGLNPSFVADGATSRPADDATAAGPAKVDIAVATSAALDDLFKAAGGDAPDPAPSPSPTPDSTSDDKAKADEEKKLADAAAAKERADDEHSDISDKAQQARERESKSADDAKAKADQEAKDKAAKEAAAKSEPEDPFKKIQLPAHSSPKAAESFEAVKRTAREQIANLVKELQAAKTAAPTAGKLPEAVEAELKELREFRRARDYANDPEFKEKFVAPISTTEEAILGKLKQNGFSDEKLATIKKIGIDKLDWEPVLAALPTVARNLVSAKLMEHETLINKREEALAQAPKLAEEFDKKRQAASSQKTAEEVALIDTIINKVLDGEDEATKKPFRDSVLNKREVPTNATEDERKNIEAHNKFVDTQNQRLQAILKDRSPRMFATLAASTLLAYRFKAEAEALRPEVEALRAKLAKIKKSSSTASAATGAPSGDGKLRSKSVIGVRGEDALDQLKRDVEAGSS